MVMRSSGSVVHTHLEQQSVEMQCQNCRAASLGCIIIVRTSLLSKGSIKYGCLRIFIV